MTVPKEGSYARGVRVREGYHGRIDVDPAVKAEIDRRRQPGQSDNDVIRGALSMPRIYYVRYWLGHGAQARRCQERYVDRSRRDDRAASLIVSGAAVVCVSRPILSLPVRREIPEDCGELIELLTA